VEQLFKVIIGPQTELVDMYKQFFSEGNETDFQRIMELKGISRADQKNFYGNIFQQTKLS